MNDLTEIVDVRPVREENVCCVLCSCTAQSQGRQSVVEDLWWNERVRIPTRAKTSVDDTNCTTARRRRHQTVDPHNPLNLGSFAARV